VADDDIRPTDTGSETFSVGAKLSGGQAKSAANILRQGTTAGAGLGKLAKGTGGMPKQKEGETASEYSARLREWRSSSPVLEGQKKALTSMGK
jgi:hypothetical protein